MLRPIKSFGQHFLKDESIAKAIANSLEIDASKSLPLVLEIGPGTGVLTKHLLDRSDIRLFLIEIDKRAPEKLLIQYPQLDGRILRADFLKVKLKDHFEEELWIIGNFPYNISTQIIFKAIKNNDIVPQLVGMFQKEVAMRIAANHGNKTYGVTSVLTQAYYDVEYLFEVDKTAFTPPPKVQSAVIRLKRTDRYESQVKKSDLFTVVKAGFSQRRKKLRNALKQVTLTDQAQDSDLMQLRAEQLSIDDFIFLANQMVL